MRAVAKQLRVSPRKMGLVAALIRGLKASDAVIVLEHTPRDAARILHEVVKSAIANAENNARKNPTDLVISEVLVSNGTMIKRMRPAAMGRAHTYRHRFSNVTVNLSEIETTTIEKEPK